MRPLDRISSIKAKLSIVIVAAVAITAVVSTIGFRTGIPIWARPVISAAIALLLVYPFSRGITSPLREMVAASRDMAAGDHTTPVTATSSDEVGELARAFNAMRAQLAEVDRQRRDLVANVSHELRTPLTGLRARFENIVDGVEVADADNVRTALAEIERLSSLVDQLLDLSRIDSGAAPLHVSTIAVSDLLVRVAGAVGPTSPHVELDIEAPDDLELVADHDRITQVVTNLAHNAVRHSSPGSTVELRALPAAGGVDLVVADHGPGIAPEERSRVFERFYRADQGRSSDEGGAGLGLAIVRSVVELHGGTIAVRANDPTGCVMVVHLPHQPRPHGEREPHLPAAPADVARTAPADAHTDAARTPPADNHSGRAPTQATGRRAGRTPAEAAANQPADHQTEAAPNAPAERQELMP